MAELKVLSGNGPRAAVRELCTQFTRTTGNGIDLQFEVNPDVVKKAQAGERFDVAVGNPSTIEQLITSGHVIADSRVDIGTAGLAVGIRAGAAKPNISTPDAVKKLLLGVASISSSDPAATSAGAN